MTRVALACLLLLTACKSRDPNAEAQPSAHMSSVYREDSGRDWPFSAASVTFVCDPKGTPRVTATIADTELNLDSPDRLNLAALLTPGQTEADARSFLKANAERTCPG